MSAKTKEIISNISDKEMYDIEVKEQISIYYKSYLQVKYGKTEKYYLIKYGLRDESSSEEF